MATNTYVALNKVTVAGTSTGTITFSSIPSTYTDLVIVGNLGSETTNAFPYLQFNGDTGNNYSFTQLYGNGASAYSSAVTGTSQLFNSDISVKQGSLNSNVIYNIMNYANTTTYKTSLSRQNTVDAADYNGALVATGLWRNTAAITSVSIKLTRGGTAYNFSSGSTFSLYGIAAEGVSPAAKATGGTIYSDDTYYYHVFTSTGVFAPTQSISADILAVAGGGAGGNDAGAGGGAGGVIYFTNQSLSATNYTCTVGAGGAASNTLSAGISGSNSTFTGLTAAVGGGGGTTSNGAAGAGGSGGGGGRNTYLTGGASTQTGTGATAYHGYAGGTTSVANYPSGGGGAGAVGGVGGAVSLISGSGGVGTSAYSSTFSAATGIGELVNGIYYLAGGGGGGANSSNGTGAGGYGGGGRGALYNAAGLGVAGSANTGGGGGGGGGGYGVTTNAAAGGSGVIVVRYTKV